MKKNGITHKNGDALYKKVGRKYVPISWKDDISDYFSEGIALHYQHRSGWSRIYNVIPHESCVIAALFKHRDAIIKAASEKENVHPNQTLLTKKQKKAWDALSKELGKPASIIRDSYHEMACELERQVIASIFGDPQLAEQARKATQHFPKTVNDIIPDTTK